MTASSSITASSFITSGGTSSQYVMGDGSLATRNTLTLGRGLTGASYNTTAAVTARLDTTDVIS